MRVCRSSLTIVLLLSLVCLLGCVEKPATPSADRYFATRWQSWLGYDQQEPILIQIALIWTPLSDTEDNIATATLSLSGGRRVQAADWRLNPGSDGDGYELCVLSLTLDPLPPGIHEFDRLELMFADRSTGSWDIGRWVIDVRPTADEGPNFVRLGKHSGVSGELDWNRFELTNVSSGDVIVRDLIFTIPGVQTDSDVLTSDDFLPGQDSSDPTAMLLPPGQTRTFHFSFRHDPSVSEKFFTIKPRLTLEVDGRQIQAALPAVIYAPFNPNDNEIQELIAAGARLR